MTTLPDKMSDLIEVALEDLEKVEAMPDVYEVDMYSWHAGSDHPKEKCDVCLAGAVMAMHFGVSPEHFLLPTDFPEEVNHLRGLDALRSGDVAAASFHMNVDPPNLGRFITPHYEDPAAFKSDMRKLAADLRAEGY